MAGITGMNIEQERLQTALEAAGVGTWDYDPVADVVVWSPRSRQLYGVPPGVQENNEVFLACIHPEHLAAVNEAIAKAMDPAGDGRFDIDYRTISYTDKSVRWLKANGKVYFAEGKPTRFIGTLIDITAQKSAELELAESERRFRNMADSSSVMLWITDPSGQCNYLNLRWVEFTGQAREEGFGLGWSNMVHPDDQPKVRRHFEEANKKHKSFHSDYRLRSAAGGYRWVFDSALPRFSEDGEFMGYFGSVIDIEDRKQAEEELRFRTTLLEAQNEASPLATLVINEQHEVFSFNRQYIELFRLTPELVQKRDRNALLDYFKDTLADFDSFLKRINDLYSNATERSHDELHMLDGRIIERFGFPNRNGNGANYGWTWLFRDITDARRAEKQLQEKNTILEGLIQEFEFVTDFMPQMVWATAPDGFHDFFNKRWFDYTGLSYDETKAEGWSKVLHPDDLGRTLEVWHHALQYGEMYNIEYRLRRYDGEFRWFLGRAIPFRAADGTILKWFGTCTDINDQKTVSGLLEQKVLERTHELQDANKNLERSNQELEQFAYVASHDLQEPLRKIRTFTDMMRAELEKGNTARSKYFIDRISQSSMRMQSLIKDLLDFSRLNRNQQAFVAVDLNTVARQVVEDLDLLIAQKGGSVHVGALPVVQGNPLQISQLFYNLVSNALKFSKADTPPVITIGSQPLGALEAKQHKLGPGYAPFTKISVSDNGIGFDPGYAEQIFTIFQRLHSRAAYEGTGIGLALCKRVALNHHGDIYAESTPGEGSVFYVLLPTEKAQAEVGSEA